MKPRDLFIEDIETGPIRREELSPDLILRIGAVRTALAEVCTFTEAQWRDAFQRDANPEQEMRWWERVVRCYEPFAATRTFSPVQLRAVFNVIVGLFSGLEAEQLQDEFAKFPESALDELADIVRQVGQAH
jgi:hypothetical protein